MPKRARNERPAAPLRRRAKKAMTDGQDALAEMSMPAMRERLDELHNHHTDLQRQYEDLRRAYEAMETERDQVTALYESLSQQRDWLDATLSSIVDAVVTTNTDGVITYLNQATAELTGWSAAAALGSAIADVMPLVHEQTRQPLLHPVYQLLKAGRGVSLEPNLILCTADERDCPVTVSVAPIYGAGESVRGAVVVVRDVTEPRRFEEHSRESQKMEALGTLAGGIAHDFNNILAIMMSYTQVALSKQRQQESVEPYLQEILAASQRGKDLVQQILIFSRQYPPERSILQLHELVQETLALLRASLPSTIAIHSRINTSSATVLANATHLQQVMMSLCSNAEYAMRKSGGTLELTLDVVEVTAELAATHPGLQPGMQVKLEIRDTGPGIAPEHLSRIFEPFFTTKEVDEGSGMGLAVAHGIVSSHEGVIIVKSIVGEGTTFEIYLPLQVVAESEPTRPDRNVTTGPSRILFVDDEMGLTIAVELLLTELGYEVSVYTNAVEALKAFKANATHFDLVIADQTMPQLTGKALAEALRAIRPNIPIILCTGYSHVIDAARAEAQGIDAFLMKPIDIQVLAETIERVLTRTQANHR